MPSPGEAKLFRTLIHLKTATYRELSSSCHEPPSSGIRATSPVRGLHASQKDMPADVLMRSPELTVKVWGRVLPSPSRDD
jgi:hypothetical protein